QGNNDAHDVPDSELPAQAKGLRNHQYESEQREERRPLEPLGPSVPPLSGILLAHLPSEYAPQDFSPSISRIRANARRTCGITMEPPTTNATLNASITSSRFHPTSPQRTK